MLSKEALVETEKRRVRQKIFNELNRSFAEASEQKIALAVSGGLDSRALMEAVALWPGRIPGQFVIVVVNHGTRPESLVEARAVAARARVLGFDASVLSIFSMRRDEATLREARYAAIAAKLQRERISFLCTAHQQDDDAEGVLLDLFGLGGGPEGSGISPSRSAEFGKVLRPFLHLERRELLLFLTSIGVADYFCDPSNENGSSQRQKARDFLRSEALRLHKRPVKRLAGIAQRRRDERELRSPLFACSDRIPLTPKMPVATLREYIQQAYKLICPEKDPRNARPAIDLVVKKAGSLGFIGLAGVDPGANSITLPRQRRLNFDLPGAKVLMTPSFLSLYRNQEDMLVQ